MRSLLCVAMALTAGCAQPREPKVDQLTLAELERETASLVSFNFVGSDDDFDYYTTPAGRRFKVAANESKMHHRSLPSQLRHAARPGTGFALFVKLNDGQWVPPDPDKMRAIFPDAGAHIE